MIPKTGCWVLKGMGVAPPPPTDANVAGAESVFVGRRVLVGKGVGERLAVIGERFPFIGCKKDNTAQTVEESVDETLFSIQERGGMGKYGCYELVFPVTVNFPDSTSQEVNSYDEFKDALRSWFEANGGGNNGGGHHQHHTPSLTSRKTSPRFSSPSRAPAFRCN